MFDPLDQRLGGALHRRRDIGVRRFPVGADKRRVFHIVPRQIAVRVAGDRNRQVWPGQLADFPH